ncbi:hypothetical protein BCT45_18640 [Vibrio breoganii]|nr:hypothetical protein BCT68_19100 [Vibrio breoganii]PMM88072.1 hypothetical protein BCT45_18640 [Vibrio breoganii]PMO83130.1 hypothetical protein BCT00_06180 [Vibrio breoganii]
MIVPSIFVGVLVLLIWSLITSIFGWLVETIKLLVSSLDVSDASSWLEKFEVWGQNTTTIEFTNFEVMNLVVVLIVFFIKLTTWLMEKSYNS